MNICSKRPGNESGYKRPFYFSMWPALLAITLFHGCSKGHQAEVVVFKGFSYLRERCFTCSGLSHTLKVYRHDKTGLEFVLLPGGPFQMGSPSSEKGRSSCEGPVHSVTIRPFLLCTTEVTNRAYELGGKKSSSRRFSRKSPARADRAAVTVSWNQAQSWCKANGLRLPSEAEWEYACRSGTKTPFFWGSNEKGGALYVPLFDKPRRFLGFDLLVGDYPPKKGASPESLLVGSLKPNAFGLFDMIGGRLEWCQDRWHNDYSGAPTGSSPWKKGETERRVVRGGDFHGFNCRPAFRFRLSPRPRYGVGFRPAVSVRSL